MNQLILASQSPRRNKILSFAGIPFRVVRPRGVSEKAKPHEAPSVLVRRLAIEKARWVSKKYPTRWVLGADTIVVCGGEIFEKPKNQKSAEKMLTRLQGSTHRVFTGVALVGMAGIYVKSHVEKTSVSFRPVSPQTIERYLKSKEPYDKAGAYDIQGTARKWIKRFNGDYFAVMGLPIRWVIQETNKLPRLEPG